MDYKELCYYQASYGGRAHRLDRNPSYPALRHSIQVVQAREGLCGCRSYVRNPYAGLESLHQIVSEIRDKEHYIRQLMTEVKPGLHLTRSLKSTANTLIGLLISLHLQDIPRLFCPTLPCP